jgi:hypothetical protein
VGAGPKASRTWSSSLWTRGTSMIFINEIFVTNRFCKVTNNQPPKQASVAPPTWVLAKEPHLISGNGVGGPNSDDWTNTLVLYIIYVETPVRSLACSNSILEQQKSRSTLLLKLLSVLVILRLFLSLQCCGIRIYEYICNSYCTTCKRFVSVT